MGATIKVVNTSRIDESIEMLQQYLDVAEIAPLLEVLRAKAAEPDDEAWLGRLAEVVDGLGGLQGAVLTYAPYIGILLAGVQFADDD